MARQEHQSLRQGLVGAWCPSLGASGLSLIDRSGLGNHGVLTNMAGQDSWKASGSGVALSFDGTDDLVSIPSSQPFQFATGQTFTVSVWIYPALNKIHSIVSFGNNGWAVYVQNDFLELAKTNVANAGSSAATNGVAFNKWTHVAVKNVVGSTVEFFINGVSVRTAAFTSTYTYATEFRVGSTQLQSLPWNGALNDIRVYNRALTPAEIRLLASRSGIGLTPRPDRAAGLPRKLSVNVGGTWRPSDAYLNVGGTWKLGQASVNVAGVWK
jgi:hypothetical protein